MLYIKNVSINFNDSPNVVSNMNMILKEKEKRCIIGETGSGKSILMQAIINLLPENANIDGEIFYKNTNILNLDKSATNEFRKNEVSYIPQGSGDGLNPVYKIKNQMIEKLPEYKKINNKDKINLTSKILDKLGFLNSKEIVEYYPHMLSGGMSQRVLIGMGVINNPNIILADEPTKGLDKSRINQVIEAFKTLNDKTIFCVTHDLNFAKEIATSISVMYASYELEMSSKEDFFKEPLHPYSEAIISALPENDLKVSMGFAPSKEDIENLSTCLFYDRCRYRKDKCLTPPPMIDVGDRKVRCWKYAT